MVQARVFSRELSRVLTCAGSNVNVLAMRGGVVAAAEDLKKGEPAGASGSAAADGDPAGGGGDDEDDADMASALAMQLPSARARQMWLDMGPKVTPLACFGVDGSR